MLKFDSSPAACEITHDRGMSVKTTHDTSNCSVKLSTYLDRRVKAIPTSTWLHVVEAATLPCLSQFTLNSTKTLEIPTNNVTHYHP